MTDLPMKGPITDRELTVVEQAGILIKDDFIIEVGAWNALKEKYFYEDVNLEEIESPAVCLPGFIDSHTHICFAGNRANDFAMRNAGKSYLDIAAEGGGIWSTVTQTRAATENELVANAMHRVSQLAAQGITTVEVKSGYGLSVKEELKMLRAINTVKRLSGLQIVTTCLAAHSVPKDASVEQYLAEVNENLLPVINKEGLSNRVDAFIEQGAFSPAQIQPYFQKAKELGFDITVHADQFSVGGSEIAVAYDAVSADHLEVSGNNEIKLLAQSNTVATALPGASIGLGVAFTPARKLLDAGACVAIATDWNPGSAPQGNLLAQAAILATYEKLTTAEVLAAITVRAAHALRLTNVGKIQKDYRADLAIFSTDHYENILYHQGQLQPSKTVLGGKLTN